MTPENFCYWLQGWFELNKAIGNEQGISSDGLKMILILPFNYVNLSFCY